MTWTIVCISIAITITACALRFAVWAFFPPRPLEDCKNEMLPRGWEQQP